MSYFLKLLGPKAQTPKPPTPRVPLHRKIYNNLPDIETSIQALKNYNPPQNANTFFILGLLVGIGSQTIYKNLTKPGSRKLLWEKIRQKWKKQTEKIDKHSSTWQRLKNRLHSFINKETRKLLNNYDETLKSIMMELSKIYSCLLNKEVIQSDDVNIPKMKEIIKNDQKEDEEINSISENVGVALEEKIQDLPSYTNLFGKRFKANSLSSLSIFIKVLLSDLLLSDKKEVMKECFSGIGEKISSQLADLKTITTDLLELRRTEKITHIISSWDSLLQIVNSRRS